ncbi:MAG: hypothetical protein Q9223_005476 [Gallowayella weberi]
MPAQYLGPWGVFRAVHFQFKPGAIRRPDSFPIPGDNLDKVNCAYYLSPTIGMDTRDQMWMSVTFLDKKNPKEFTGYIMISFKDPPVKGHFKDVDNGSRFNIQGEGKITEGKTEQGAKSEVVEGHFRIEKDTGMKLFDGIEGLGSMKVTLNEEEKDLGESINMGGSGDCGYVAFEKMNKVGEILEGQPLLEVD